MVNNTVRTSIDFVSKNTLKSYRLRRGLTQFKLCKLFPGKLYIHKVSNIENGISVLDLDLFLEILWEERPDLAIEINKYVSSGLDISEPKKWQK